MIEIVVALSIVSVLGAVVFFSLSLEKGSDSARIAIVAAKLDDLMEAIAGKEITLPATSFRQTVKVYPGKLTDLTSALTALNAAISKNSCGQPYTNTNVTAANLGRPYYSIEFQTAGTKLADGFVANNAIVRADAATITRSTLAIQFPSVTSDDAQALDLYMDGVADGDNGAIRYTLNATNPVTVSYLIAVRGC